MLPVNDIDAQIILNQTYCVVPQNIHTPTMEGIGELEKGVERSIWFPDALQFYMGSKILPYLLCGSFT